MAVWLWVPQLLVSTPLRSSFSTHLSIPLGSRVRFGPRLGGGYNNIDNDVAIVYTNLCRELGLDELRPLSDLRNLPRLVQLALCMQASLSSLSRSSRDLSRVSMMEASVLEIDPGAVLALHCCARYGVPCVARVDEFVRPAMRLRLKVSIRSVEKAAARETPLERDRALLNLANKLASHVVSKVLSAERCSDALEYLRLQSALSTAIAGEGSCSSCEGLKVVLPWLGKELDVVSIEVDCYEASGC
ncbi:MAG: hypothetical protein GXO32_03055 [Crenarchaeota archaeon]|nr:hypothetical protein [Thermoproteota archaeon]